jgi:hypothetical protein
MMTTFLTGENIVKTVRDSIDASEGADLAVAYWGAGATERLGLDKRGKKVRILCDPGSLACNPSELKKLLDRGVELKTEDGLHAKVYITTHQVVIGSANASINGLGEEGYETDLGLEAAIESSDEDIMRDASDWFEKHWKTAESVDKARLEEIKPFWQPRSRRGSLLSLLLTNPALFHRMPIRLVVFEEPDWKNLRRSLAESEKPIHSRTDQKV